MYKHFFKRIIGFFGALCGVLLLSPVFIVVAAWLHFANKGAGAFFFQERIGKGEKPFKIIKFKSMTDEKDADGNLLPDAQRLTVAGRFVRSTSIDELPQFFNILKGDMAFIGPRPLPKVYLPYYTEEEAKQEFKEYQGTTERGYPYTGYEYDGQKYHDVTYLGEFEDDEMPHNDTELLDILSKKRKK